jgi:DNA polymerase (family X)
MARKRVVVAAASSILQCMMEKPQIVGVLEEIGQLLELKGENVFKIRAYQNGARSLESFAGDLDAVIANGTLDTVPGIGKALADKIATLRAGQPLRYYQELRASLPPGLIEMLEIPGFGPKKVRKVYEALGIDTLAGLAKAAEDGRLAELPGFGAKSQANILSGIRNREAYAKRHLWWDAHAVAMPILDGLRGLPQVQRAEAAGSLRRGRETVGDLDFIVAATEPGPVMDWFVAWPGVVEVTAHGDTKSSVRLEGGLQADLRVVPDDRFVYALHHFTGSKEHNVKLRQRALARGYSMSEWGLFAKDAPREADLPAWDRPLAVAGIRDEADLFRALGLHWVPPELREGSDEIEAAESAPFPRLVEVTDLRGVFHNHTHDSDGNASIAEMAAGAAARGWQYLGIADHSQASFQAHGLSPDRLRAQIASIRAFNAEGISSVRLLAGCEVDILRDGSLDFPADLLNELDYVVLSVHQSMTGLSASEMTERICRAIASPLRVRKILGHPTGRLLLRREPYPIDLEPVFATAAAHGCWIELNANPSRLDLDWRFWRQARAAGVACVINPDAHAVHHLDFVRAGVQAARKAGLTAADIVNCQPLDAVLATLRPHQVG